jgi:hypothetical protein
MPSDVGSERKEMDRGYREKTCVFVELYIRELGCAESERAQRMKRV